jgi:hypothetical protein
MMVLVACVLLSVTHEVLAFYNPSTGRWLSRDPIREPGFGVLASTPHEAIQEGEAESYLFVRNDSVQHFDLLGLDVDVSWTPPTCPKPFKTVFIQVLYGGSGSYNSPRTDNGTAGWFAPDRGCPDYYLPPGMEYTFQDSPSGTHGWLTGPVHFIVCRVCLRRCCSDEWRIASVGPCVYWKKGDRASSLYNPGFTIVDRPPAIWQVGLDRSHPAAARGLCYKCDATR